ncbi:hypothetical protein QQ045_030850 [Rhodiola kirilowii]
MLQKLAELSQTNIKGEQANLDRVQAFWKRIWRLKVQPKVKIFAWRVFHNFLPSAENLVRRHCNVGMDCQICGWRRESTTHTLLQCWWAKAYWNLAELIVASWPSTSATQGAGCGSVCQSTRIRSYQLFCKEQG